MKPKYTFFQILLLAFCLCPTCFCKPYYVEYEEEDEADTTAGGGQGKDMEEIPISPPMVASAAAGRTMKRTSANSGSIWSSSSPLASSASDNLWDNNSAKMVGGGSPLRASPSGLHGGWPNDPHAALPVRFFPLYTSFQPRSPRRRSSSVVVGGMRKRQSILYRQCFFNPISCFRK